MGNMKIIQYSDFGGPEVLELVESEKPLPATVSLDRGMNVTVHAVGLNPIVSGKTATHYKPQKMVSTPFQHFSPRSSP